MAPRATRKNRKTANSWGYHLILDLSDCDAEAIRSKATIASFTKALVHGIDMVAFGPPRIVKFGNGLQKGYTLVQLIETSCVSAHFVEETNDAYIDIFSCKTFDPKDAIKIVKEFFKPAHIKQHFLKRQA